MWCFSFGVLFALAFPFDAVSSFSSSGSRGHKISAGDKSFNDVKDTKANVGFGMDAFGKSALIVLASFALVTSPVHADEYGRETEAPTLFTGETTMVRYLFV
jgi:hypothetical protein